MSEQTTAQLDQLIATARLLGFADDVAFWEAEKRRLIAAQDKGKS